jgi:uncharacterized coiled-coil protein SlyX
VADIDFSQMQIEELVSLHERVQKTLDERIAAERADLAKRQTKLEKLLLKLGKDAAAKPAAAKAVKPPKVAKEPKDKEPKESATARVPKLPKAAKLERSAAVASAAAAAAEAAEAARQQE